MSINLGTEAIQALERLRSNKDFQELRLALLDQTHARMHTAIECDQNQRIEQTAYARAMRDIAVAFEGASTGTKPTQVDKVATVNRGRPVPQPGVRGKGALPTGIFTGESPDGGTDGIIS
jgi:hypothetical protein